MTAETPPQPPAPVPPPMPPGAPGPAGRESASTRGNISVLALFRESWSLMRRNPWRAMAPLALTLIPLAILTAAANVTLYQTAFADEPFRSIEDLASEDAGGALFALAIVNVVYLLFSLVGSAGTIVAIAALHEGRDLRVPESLDPAFTRMGALLVIFAIVAPIGIAMAALAVTIVVPIAMSWVLVRLAVAMHACVLEGLGPAQSIRRSWELVRGNMLKFYLLAFCSFPVILPVVLLAAPWTFSGPSRDTLVALDAVRTLLLAAVTVPALTFVTATTTLYYFKIRANER